MYLSRAGHLVDPFLGGETVALGRVEVVDDRVPDRARELEEVRVVRPEGAQCFRVAGPSVVLVEHRARGVAEHERRIAEGSVGRRRHREDRDLEAVEVERFAVAGLDEVPEPEPLAAPGEERRGEVGEEHPGALVDVAGEELGIEMVAMEVRHVEEVGPRRSPPVPSRSLRGKGNQDPKYAGVNHGSHSTDPWRVST